MAYLVKSDPPPVIDVKDRAVEWIELIGTWGILAVLLYGLWQTGLGKHRES